MGRRATYWMLATALSAAFAAHCAAKNCAAKPPEGQRPESKDKADSSKSRPRAAKSPRAAEQNGAQPNVTLQLPSFGVAIDAEGVLQVEQHPALDGQVHAQRVAAARRAMPGKLAAWSDVRKVSLVRLERVLRRQAAAGRKPDDVQLHLAGLQRIQYVFLLPESKDIVIAGPAEGWLADPDGRAVGLSTGRPALCLDDLIAALRAYAPGGPARPMVGCSIDPPQEGLKRLVEFQRQMPHAVPEAQREPVAQRTADGVRQALGMAEIRVFGIDPRTHMAQVLLEADYRMKRIGIGLEDPPVRMATFAPALSGGGGRKLERWWFVPDYDGVRVTEDGLALELVGQGVKLLGEDKLIAADGQLAAAAATASKASELFTSAFTRNYEKIAGRVPVYAQMRTVVDLLIAAAFIRQQEFYRRADWSLGLFADETALPIATLSTPRQAACVANVFWKGNRLFTPAGGGVTIEAHQALDKRWRLPDTDGSLGNAKGQISEPADADQWWWD